MTEYERYLTLEKDLLLQKQNMVDILTPVGVEASNEETLNTLVPKFLEYVNSTTSKLGVNTQLADIIKQDISGEVITVNDVSPIEHNLEVSIKRKNLFDINSVEVLNGEIQNNSIGGDSGGSIDVLLPAGTYTISFEKSAEDLTIFLRNGRVNNGYFSSSTNSSITFTYDASYDGYLRISYFRGTLSNIQIEKGRTATEYTPYISDLSEVSINRLGKNLFNWEEVTENGFIPSSYGTHIVKIVDGVITNNMGAYGTGVYAVTEPITLPAGNYILSAKVMADKTEGNKKFWLGYFTDKVYASAFELANYNTWEYHEYKFTLTEATPISQWRFQGGGQPGDYTNLKILFKDMCLTALSDGEYEPYQKQMIVSNPDGTVEGLTSLSPNMTLTSDTNGVIINCKYNVDTKTYIDNEFAKIETLILEA